MILGNQRIAIVDYPPGAIAGQTTLFQWSLQAVDRVLLGLMVLQQSGKFFEASATSHHGGEGDSKKLLLVEVHSVLSSAEQVLYQVGIASDVPPNICLQKPRREQEQFVDFPPYVFVAVLKKSKVGDHMDVLLPSRKGREAVRLGVGQFLMATQGYFTLFLLYQLVDIILVIQEHAPSKL